MLSTKAEKWLVVKGENLAHNKDRTTPLESSTAQSMQSSQCGMDLVREGTVKLLVSIIKQPLRRAEYAVEASFDGSRPVTITCGSICFYGEDVYALS